MNASFRCFEQEFFTRFRIIGLPSLWTPQSCDPLVLRPPGLQFSPKGSSFSLDFALSLNLYVVTKGYSYLTHTSRLFKKHPLPNPSNYSLLGARLAKLARAQKHLVFVILND